MNAGNLLNTTVQDLILSSASRAQVVLALADLGITPRYATWPLERAARALGLSPATVERRLAAALEGQG